MVQIRSDVDKEIDGSDSDMTSDLEVILKSGLSREVPGDMMEVPGYYGEPKQSKIES